MKVRDVMTRSPTCCTPDTSLFVVARLMIDCDCGAIPVVDLPEGKPIGMITDRDIVMRAIAVGRDPMYLKARDCMTASAITVTEDTSLHDCLELLELGQIRRVIVVDSFGRCCGIVSQADIAAHASKRQAGDLLRHVSHPTSPAFAH
jgi:CBS domain-containing protein